VKKSINTPPDYKNSIMVLKMAAHDVPQFKEVHGKNFVYYGNRNEYPDYLLDLYNRSAKHNAIVNGKAKYVFGSGFEKEGDEIVNAENETLNDVVKKCILDVELFAGFYVEVIWDKGKKNIAELRHVCFSDVRSNKDNTQFYYTDTWTKSYLNDKDEPTVTGISNPQSNKDWQVYAPYDEKNKTGKQLFFYKGYRPGLKTYPLPEYQGAIVYIDIDVQIADYWNNAIHNGLSASHIINFYNGIPTEAEQEKLEEGISDKLTGARSSKFILNFADKKDNGSEIQSLAPEDLDKHLQILNETVQQEIFSGHHITSPMLFGIKTAGQLGGRTELIEANELFQNLYVNPKQQLVEKLIGILAKAKGIKGELKLGKIEPIGYQFSESIIRDVIPHEAIADMVASRMGIDLKKYPKRIIPEAPAKFSVKWEERILDEFKKRGKKRGGVVISQRPMESAYIKNLAENEAQFIDFAKKEIKKNPSIVPVINPLKPLISPTGEPIGRISVVYTYAFRDAIPVKDRDSEEHPSRDWCVERMEEAASGKTWTREEIEGMTNDIGESAWEMRGGWYTAPGTDTSLPYCRHVWIQQVIIT